MLFRTLVTAMRSPSRRGCLASFGNVGPQSLLDSRQKHTLPDLPYDYNALEPVVSAEIMQLHHSKHHATYVNNLNVAEEKCAEAAAKGDVSTAITRDFGSLDNLKTQLSASTVAVQGSGWGWLG